MGKISCNYCGEAIEAGTIRCPHCDEMLVADGQKQGMSGGVIALIILAVCALLCCPVMIIAAIAVPNLVEARKSGNEAAAIGALKTIGTAQLIFREGDKDGDNLTDYGTLNELKSASLIDSVLGSGNKQGYRFQVLVSPTDPEFAWIGLASPLVPGTTGERFFLMNHEGITFYSLSPPAGLPSDCKIPSSWTPIGR